MKECIGKRYYLMGGIGAPGSDDNDYLRPCLDKHLDPEDDPAEFEDCKVILVEEMKLRQLFDDEKKHCDTYEQVILDEILMRLLPQDKEAE